MGCRELEQKEKRPINPGQRRVLDSGLLTTGFNCILQMPTGSGKTWLAEQAISDTLKHGARAVYLSPLRALASELCDRWSKQFPDYSVGAFTGDTISTNAKCSTAFSKAQLLVMTPERLDACTRWWRAHWHWITEVDLVVVDEIHLLGEQSRGPRLEGALSRLQRLNPFIRVLGLSATLGNREELADWLNGVDLVSEWRNTPLEWRTSHFRKADEKPSMLLAEVKNCVTSGGKSLIFVQSRRRAESLSTFLQEQGIAASHHHAGMDAAQRDNVELKFRAKKLDALLSTGTLEMGLNLPVRQVVLYDTQAFDGTDFAPLSVNTVWQRAGRAGRPGLDQSGEVVIFAPSWDKSPRSYEKGNFDSIQSGLGQSQALAEQVLTEVASGLCRCETQLKRTFDMSLAQRQKRLPKLQATLKTMLDSGMLTEIPAKSPGRPPLLQATRLGRIAVRQMLTPEAVLHLHRKLSAENSHNLTFLDLLLVATSSPGFEPLIPCDFEDLDELAEGLQKEPSSLLQGTNREISEGLSLSGRRLIALINTSMITRKWTHVGNFDQVAEAGNCYPYEIRRVCENLERILSASVAMLTPPKKDKTINEAHEKPLPNDFVSVLERARTLLCMVKNGIDETAATLTYVPGIGATWARRLAEIGIGDIEDLAQAQPETLLTLNGLSQTRASAWIESASEKLRDYSPHRLREHGPTTCNGHTTWLKGIDPYRLGRAVRLIVKTTRRNHFIVTGGLDPHQVYLDPKQCSLICDCPDFSRGHTCKHILAVRLANGDRDLHSITEKLTQNEHMTSLDLQKLWFDSRR